MQDAVPVGVGAMTAIIGLPAPTLEGLCREVSGSSSGQVEIANYNSPTQIVVSGHARAVAALAEKVKAVKGTAIPLPVSAPFHCSLMRPAAERMRDLLEEAEFSRPSAPILANVTGAVADPYSATLLIEQIVGSVRWTQTLEGAQGMGCTRYVECGPGKVLMGLARKTLAKDAVLLNTDEILETIATLRS